MASPSAIAAPGLGMPPGFGDAIVTSPMSNAQQAGTSTSVASVIARHLRWGESGSMPTFRRRRVGGRPVLIPSPIRR